MLRMSEVTTSPIATCTKPLSANEIFRSLPSSYNIARPILDQYLTLLVDDPVRPLEAELPFDRLHFYLLDFLRPSCPFLSLDGVCGEGGGKWRRDVCCQYPFFI